MFAVLHASPETPLEPVLEVAQAFTPRFQAIGPFVLLDVGGLSALFETPRELGDAIHRACPACRSVALASTAAAAMLLACGRQGLTVLEPAAEKAALAQLPIDVLVGVTEARLSAAVPVASVPADPPYVPPASSGAKPAPSSTPSPTPSQTPLQTPSQTPSPAVGWRHPRDTHQAHHTRRPRVARAESARERQAVLALHQCRATLRRWGIHRLGALAALPRPDVHARPPRVSETPLQPHAPMRMLMTRGPAAHDACSAERDADLRRPRSPSRSRCACSWLADEPRAWRPRCERW